MHNKNPAIVSESYYEYSRPEMLPFVPKFAKRILEIGCGRGAFAARVKARQAVEYVGVELLEEAAQIARTQIDQVIMTDIETSTLPFPENYFDCIICNDVLEHLRDPWACLHKLCGYLTSGGYVVASIPNMRHFEVIKEFLIHRQWHYQDDGILDRTHLRFFTDRTVRELFEQSGLEVISLQGINGGPFPWKFGMLNRLLLNALDDMRWQQFACVGQLR